MRGYKVTEQAEQAADAAEEAHRYNGAIGIGQPSQRYSVDYSDHGPGICVTYCLTPGQRRRGIRCPSCYGDVDIKAIGQDGVEPSPGRAERLAAWVGGWVGAFCEAVMFPFRVGRAHTEALIRDRLQQSIDAGLTADIPGLADILAVLEGIEEELRAIRSSAEAPGEGA